jgi:hypothetical protein
VQSGQEKGTGTLLAVEKGAPVVLIDVEGSLLENPFLRAPKPGSQNALEKLITLFPVVYLQAGWVGAETTKGWLKKWAFPLSPVLPWDNGDVMQNLVDRGITAKAFIGTPQLIESARGQAHMIFSFNDIEGAVWVKNWAEIVDTLREQKEYKGKQKNR